MMLKQENEKDTRRQKALDADGQAGLVSWKWPSYRKHIQIQHNCLQTPLQFFSQNENKNILKTH